MTRSKTIYCTACYLFFAPQKTGPWTCPRCGNVNTLGLEEIATPYEVRRVVTKIEESGSDDPGKHIQEDCLYISVLRAIASGRAPNPRDLAREALRVADMDFDRWYE